MFFDVPSITTFVLLLLPQNNLAIMKMLEFVLVDLPILLPIKMNREWSIHVCCYLERTMTMYGGFNDFGRFFFFFWFLSWQLSYTMTKSPSNGTYMASHFFQKISFDTIWSILWFFSNSNIFNKKIVLGFFYS
jgi:hypothetical protein